MTIQAILSYGCFENDCVCPAEEIAKKLNIPKEFISKILQSLTESGIDRIEERKSGRIQA